MATEQMEKHIAKQIKKMARGLAKAFENNPLYYETFYTITRKESMVCEDFDAMVNKMFAEWKEKVRNKISDSNWEYILELEMDCSLEHEPCDSKGMALVWTVSIEWTAEGFNPFE